MKFHDAALQWPEFLLLLHQRFLSAGRSASELPRDTDKRIPRSFLYIGVHKAALYGARLSIPQEVPFATNVPSASGILLLRFRASKIGCPLTLAPFERKTYSNHVLQRKRGKKCAVPAALSMQLMAGEDTYEWKQDVLLNEWRTNKSPEWLMRRNSVQKQIR